MTPTVAAWLLVLAMESADGGAPATPTPAKDRSSRPSLIRAPQVTAPSADAGEPTADQYQLTRARDGSGDLTYEASGFTSRIARDGGVTFQNRHTSALQFIPIKPGPGLTGVPTLEGLIRGRGKTPKDAPKGDRRDDEPRPPTTTFSRYRPDPREACTYPRPCFWDASAILVGAVATGDSTEMLMRLAHQDPHRYAKARFLTATQPMRARMAARAHAEDIQRSAADLPGRLNEIACDGRLTIQERRGVITGLGDEMDASPEADRSREAIAQALRRLDGVSGDGAVPGCAADVRRPPTR